MSFSRRESHFQFFGVEGIQKSVPVQLLEEERPVFSPSDRGSAPVENDTVQMHAIAVRGKAWRTLLRASL